MNTHLHHEKNTALRGRRSNSGGAGARRILFAVSSAARETATATFERAGGMFRVPPTVCDPAGDIL
jgi:hypothetical protein